MSNPITPAETVVLGYSSTGIHACRYHIDEFRGSRPFVRYPVVGGINVAHVGDWLTEEEAVNLGRVSELIVRPYRVGTES